MTGIRRVGLIVIVAGLAIVGGGVAAASTEQDSFGTFPAKVATILGLDEETVRVALEQARTELKNENLTARLNGLVESGKLTQSQADEKRAWISANGGAKTLKERMKGKSRLGLDRLVESGKLTQSQADEKRAWISANGGAKGKHKTVRLIPKRSLTVGSD